MCDSATPPTPPSNEEIQEALEDATQIRESVIHYRSVAQEIDDRFERANEDRRLSLDDLPYGEELIRTRELPEELSRAIENLERISESQISAADVPRIFDESSQIIENSRSTLDDCTSLPPEDEDEDEDDF